MDDSSQWPADVLERLCRHYGISAAYFDAFGTQRQATPENLAALLAEFGVQAGAATGDGAEPFSMPAMPPVLVVAPHAPHWAVQLSQGRLAGRLRWQIRDEEGRLRNGEADAHPQPDGGCTRDLTEPLASGYHWLQIEGLEGETMVIASPGRCDRPPSVRDGGRVWGPAVQLYALRSPRNWGIGDFGDLDALIDSMAGQGADVVGLNPLHALFPTDPQRASPYSPSSRQRLNVLYIDVEAVDDFVACEPARRRVESPEFQAKWTAGPRGTPTRDR